MTEPLFFSDQTDAGGSQRVLTFFATNGPGGEPRLPFVRSVQIESRDDDEAAAPTGWRRVVLRYKIGAQVPAQQNMTTWMPGARLTAERSGTGKAAETTLVGTAYRRKSDPPLAGTGEGALFCDFSGADGRRVCTLRGTVRPSRPPPAEQPRGQKRPRGNDEVVD